MIYWLHDKTGRAETYWFHRIEGLIRKHSTEPKEVEGFPHYAKHASCDTRAVLHELIDELIKTSPATGEPYDENMRLFACLSAICGMWYVVIHKAKAHDPHRPASVRRKGYRQWLDFVPYLLEVALNPRLIRDLVVNQRWDDPWGPEVESGDFL